jgi:MFS family permease
MRNGAAAVSIDRPLNYSLVLWACIVAAIQFVMDSALMALIAPSVARDLGASRETISLLSSIFALMLATFILVGGTFGDIYGRKRLLMVGIITECVTALLAAFAPNTTLLILLRALAGVGGAFISPLTIAIISSTFPPEQQPKVMGRYVGMIGLASGLSVSIVQIVNQTLGWRATFGLIVLIGVVALAMLPAIPESSSEGQHKIDWGGLMLAGIGLVGLVYGINQAGRPEGFVSAAVLVPCSVGLLALVALFFYDSHYRFPALPVKLFKSALVLGGVFMALAASFAQSGTLFQLNLYLQMVLRFSPSQSGLYVLPFSLASFVVSLFIGRLARIVPLFIMAPVALLIMALGVLLMALAVGPTINLFMVFIPLALIGSGFVIANTLRIRLIVGSAPPDLSGSASALSNLIINLGSALGISLLSAFLSIFSSKAYRNILAGHQVRPEHIQQSVNFLKTLLSKNSGNAGDQYGMTVVQVEQLEGASKTAYLVGLLQVYWCVVIVLLALAIVTFVCLMCWRRSKSV